MRFISTRGQVLPVSLKEAVSRGLAEDGGLYMPERVPQLPESDLIQMTGEAWPALAREVLSTLLGGGLTREEVGRITENSLDFPLPVVRLGDRIHVLELFHGPTLAFKDIGARFMARLLTRFRRDGDPPITVLTATSGDTGGAVADALYDVPGVRVVVLFPDGKVTPRQERQFSTLGGNVHAVAVQGDFDDCQRLAKEAFASQAQESSASGTEGGSESEKASSRPLPTRLPLTSANSINVGRFLPQITYFFWAWKSLREIEKNRTDVLFSVPSGNFGNLAAGLMARRMGLPGSTFLAATNINDVVPQYLETGVYSPRSSRRTVSTAMDVGRPSNLDRILHLYGGDLGELRKSLVGQRVTDTETLECIRRTFDETGYILDPHSAVGLVALEEVLNRRPGATGVLLATAHPAKFAEVVEPAIGKGVAIPPELATRLDAPRRVVEIEPRLEALQEVLVE
jgi:threonine synthase